MTDSMFDLFDQIFKYNGNNVSVIVDDDNNPWFSGAELADLLEYDNTQNAILNNVKKRDKRIFADLKIHLDEIPKNSQPHAVYINEPGFYCLIFGSRKELAKDFKMWVIRTVLPGIRQFGYYQIEQKYKYKLKELNETIQNQNHRIEVLENNQKKQKFPDGGLVYALEPIGMLKENTDKKLIRIGRSEHMQKRWSTYNTAVPDNFKLLYYIQVDNPIAGEYCIRAMLHKFIYRAGKDYYLCNLDDIIKIFDGCAKMIETDKFPEICDKCKENEESVKLLEKHLKDDHGLRLRDLNKQIGGNPENEYDLYHHKYIKYKKKYLDLKTKI